VTFSLTARVSADPDDMCLRDCGDTGLCAGGVCQCDAALGAGSAAVAAAAGAQVLGEVGHCELIPG
jgi:hypothetical protein